MKFTVEEIDLMVSALFNFEDKMEEFKELFDFMDNGPTNESAMGVYIKADEKRQMCNKLICRFEQELRKEAEA